MTCPCSDLPPTVSAPGVGKTTVVALLGRRAAIKDLRVLVVDLDPQANLSQAYMGNAYRRFLANQQPSIVEVFDGYRPPSGPRASTTPLDPEDVVHNVYTDGTLAYIPSRFDFSDNLVRAVKPDPKVLSHFIADHFQDRDLGGNSRRFRLFAEEFLEHLGFGDDD